MLEMVRKTGEMWQKRNVLYKPDNEIQRNGYV
jgi:hypothetical protein